MDTPRMSAGSMSLVNWMRWKCRPSDLASTCASVVLPTPGMSSISRWPRASRQASAMRICGSLPRMIWPAASMMRATGESPAACNCRFRSIGTFYVSIHGLMPTAFITHPDCLKHDMGAGHPEQPARLTAIEDQLIASGVDAALQRYDAPVATDEQLARVHPMEYINAIREAAPETGRVHLDPDTAMNPFTLSAALHAAGAGVLAVDLIFQKKIDNAFCSVRPPGHHACRA